MIYFDLGCLVKVMKLWNRRDKWDAELHYFNGLKSHFLCVSSHNNNFHKATAYQNKHILPFPTVYWMRLISKNQAKNTKKNQGCFGQKCLGRFLVPVQPWPLAMCKLHCSKCSCSLLLNLGLGLLLVNWIRVSKLNSKPISSVECKVCWCWMIPIYCRTDSGWNRPV